MFDKDKLNNEVTDLKEFYERVTGHQMKRHWKSWEGPCPLCNGDDRFWINDDTSEHGYCRQCGKQYKAVDIVQAHYGLSFYEACNKTAELLGLSSSNCAQWNGETKPSAPKTPPPPINTTPDEPSEQWQQEVKTALKNAVQYLWSDAGKPHREYLHARGFDNETIRRYAIGYNPTYRELDVTHNGEPVKAYTGLWIPTFMRTNDYDEKPYTLMRVKIRMDDEKYKTMMKEYEEGKRERKPEKYYFIRGSKAKSLFCASFARPKVSGSYPNIIYCEGEFDAMTINQAAGDICRAVTFGAHGYIGDAEQWQSWFRIPDKTVICFDNDSDEKIRTAVRRDEEKLRSEIIKAQSLDVPEYRAQAPIIQHLPDHFHDWNDILQLPNGAQIIRDILSEFFRR